MIVHFEYTLRGYYNADAENVEDARQELKNKMNMSTPEEFIKDMDISLNGEQLKIVK